MIYRVANWNDHFENNKSREREQCSYVCVPNKQHGMGLSRVLSEPDGTAIYGVFQLVLGAVSRQKKPRSGWLTDDGHQTGTAWAPSDLALLWRRPEPEIVRALAVLSSSRVGWLECVPRCEATHEPDWNTEKNGTSAPDGHQVPAECPPSALEGKRRERNRRGPAASPPSDRGLAFADWFRSTLDPNAKPTDKWRERWARCFDEMIRIDKRTDRQISDVCKWARADSFWSPNFQSPMKLRERKNGVLYFDTFNEQMKKPTPGRTQPPPTVQIAECDKPPIE